MMGGADGSWKRARAEHAGVRQWLHLPVRQQLRLLPGRSRRPRGSGPCAALSALAATAVLLGGCELTEVTLAESDDVVIAETRLVLNLESGDRAASLDAYTYLHRTLSAARGDEVEGAIVRLSGASGASRSSRSRRATATPASATTRTNRTRMSVPATGRSSPLPPSLPARSSNSR